MVLLSLLPTDNDAYKPLDRCLALKKDGRKKKERKRERERERGGGGRERERERERERKKGGHLVSYAFPSGDGWYMEIVLGVGRDSCKCIIK